VSVKRNKGQSDGDHNQIKGAQESRSARTSFCTPNNNDNSHSSQSKQHKSDASCSTFQQPLMRCTCTLIYVHHAPISRCNNPRARNNRMHHTLCWLTKQKNNSVDGQTRSRKGSQKQHYQKKEYHHSLLSTLLPSYYPIKGRKNRRRPPIDQSRRQSNETKEQANGKAGG
jgi:hypothetical protein